MIEASSAASALNFDYAAIAFIRKTKNDKIFEFNIPLAVLDKLVEALQIIKKDNAKFFNSAAKV
jgi:hypothetical protein